MTDSKITQLTEITTPTGKVLVPVENDVLGTPVTRSVDAGNLPAFIPSLLSANQANTETLSGNKTLTDANGAQHRLDPNGSSRDVTLPAEASTNDWFVIYNAGSAGEDLVVKDDTPSTVLTIEAGETGVLLSDGASWVGFVASASLVAQSDIDALHTEETIASGATPTPAWPTGSKRHMAKILALGTDATFGAPTGSPANGDALMLRIKDDGTSRSLAYNAIYRAFGEAMPTATTISKTLYLLFIYNSTDTKWDYAGKREES